jgi:hypothetical protein
LRPRAAMHEGLFLSIIGTASVWNPKAPNAAWLLDADASYCDHGLKASEAPTRPESVGQADCRSFGGRGNRGPIGALIACLGISSEGGTQRRPCASGQSHARATACNCAPSGRAPLGGTQEQVDKARLSAFWRRLLDNLKIRRFLACELNRPLFRAGSHKTHSVTRADLRRPNLGRPFGLNYFDFLWCFHRASIGIVVLCHAMMISPSIGVAGEHGIEVYNYISDRDIPSGAGLFSSGLMWAFRARD